MPQHQVLDLLWTLFGEKDETQDLLWLLAEQAGGRKRKQAFSRLETY